MGEGSGIQAEEPWVGVEPPDTVTAPHGVPCFAFNQTGHPEDAPQDRASCSHLFPSLALEEQGLRHTATSHLPLR